MMIAVYVNKQKQINAPYFFYKLINEIVIIKIQNE